MTRFASAIVSAAAAAVATVTAPTAAADSFVECQFGMAKPFIYTVDGADYMGSRVEVSNCRTNLPSTPLTFQMHLTASGAPPDVVGPLHTNSYTETRDVHDGDSFSIAFPNDDRLVGLYPGVYGAKVTALSNLPGYTDARFFDYKCSTWQFRGVECTPAVHA